MTDTTSGRVVRAINRNGVRSLFLTVLRDPTVVPRFLLDRNGHVRVLPGHALERPPDRGEVVGFIGGVLPDVSEDAVVDTWLELYDDVEFRAHVESAFRSTTTGPRKYYHNWRELLYVLVRLRRPSVVVETGVLGGLSSAYVLNALEENGSGKLVSIDLGDESGLPSDISNREIGWMVPESPRSRWDLRLGDSASLLPDVLSDEDVDVFFSDVPNELLRSELETAADRLRPGAIVVTCYPLGSDAEHIWTSFAEEWLVTTAPGTRWASVDGESKVGAGVLRANLGDQ